MRSKKLFLIFGIFFLIILLCLSFASAYVRAVTSGVQYGSTVGLGAFSSMNSLKFDKSMCEQGGQDLLVQIVPFGCTPALVRSDLLEEEDVQVFCQLGATQINPLIEIESIDYINFVSSQQQYSKGVKYVQYFPSKAALSASWNNLDLTSYALSDLGYVVITLNREPNESAMPEYVEGNLTARIRYDIKNAFGVGDTSFYIPTLSDEEWDERYVQYSFWQGRGYLRALGVDNEGAQIAIYSDDSIVNTGTFSREGKTYSKAKYSNFYLKEGETSDELYLPGFSPCLATLNVQLQEIVNPDTRVKLKVNSDYIEVAKGEKFFDNTCWVKEFNKAGLYQSVKIYCKNDGEPITQTLQFSPRIKLSIDGETREYEVGDWLFKTDNEEKSVYLGYVGSFERSEKSEELYAFLIALPEHKDKLDADDLNSVNTQANLLNSAQTGAGVYDAIATGLKRIAKIQIKLGKAVVQGENFYFVPYKNPKTGIVAGSEKIQGKDVSIMGFGTGEDGGILTLREDEYTLVKTTLGNNYRIIDESGKETGLRLDELNTGSEMRLILEPDNILGVSILSGYGVFFSEENCMNYKDCPQFKLSTGSEFKPSNKYSFFFEDLAGAVVFPKENKLIVYKAVFSDSSEEEFQQYYEEAMKDFQTIEVSFANEKESASSEETYGERALYNSIYLASKLNKKKTMLELCEVFNERYAKSILYAKVLELCENEYKISSDYLSSLDASSNGIIKEISFEGIYEPSFEEYGIELAIRGPNGESRVLNLEKEKIIGLDEFRTESDRPDKQEYVKLDSIDEDSDSADVYIYVKGDSAFQRGLVPNIKSLSLDDSYGYNGYTFTLKKVNLKQSAKVAIKGNTNFQYSEADFSFKIGIEKRSFPLTPEKANKHIETLNKTIAGFQKASDALATTVRIGKAACTATGAALTLKNLWENRGGKALAREKVMKGVGGWTEKCTSWASDNSNDYSSLDDCLLKNSDAIDKEVDELAKVIEVQNEKIKKLQSNFTNEENGFINTKSFVENYSSQVILDLKDENLQEKINSGTGADIDFSTIDTLLGLNSFENNKYSLEQLKEIELYSSIVNNKDIDEGLRKTAEKRLYNVLNDVQVNAKTYVLQKTFQDESKLESSGLLDLGERKAKEISIYHYEEFSKSAYSNYDFGDDTKIIDGEFVYAAKDKLNGKEYLIVYESKGTVKRTYTINNVVKNLTLYRDKDEIVDNPFDLYFQKYEDSAIRNKYKNPTLRYYEEGVNKGDPAIVPFDKENGWYAATKAFTTSSTLQAYDDSGIVRVFWVCNVGPDGLEDFFNEDKDDVCEMFNSRTGQSLTQFPGLTENQAMQKITEAQQAINNAQNAYRSGVKKARIGGVVYDVGAPAISTAAVKCQDFMSPKDCNILFNVCDPVICPNSRCDLGGTYPVQDVIQSGIIGSIALCLPNAKEGIKVPICISGVQSGLDGFISVQKSYRDCLQTSIDTGQTVGICDEVYSIYLCDFLWKQTIPLAKFTIPKIINLIFKEGARGGGEYLAVQEALTSAQQSVDYFKGYYAANSWKAFKMRSTEEIGTEVCKVFPSVVYPGSGNFLDNLIEPDSPVQFTGNFDEIPLTTATNPPTSHYKVFYHIYAGKDRGAYYRVILKSGTGSSYYQDTLFDRIVGSGYIPAGQYTSNTTDFTAPSGYKTMCIIVNGQEECNFEKVSSSFGVNYMSDLYIKEQTTSEVKTEAECISGKASLYSLLNPNIQSAAEEILDPKIYENGIIRVCATDNPGMQSDKSYEDPNYARWVPVGYCGDKNVKCWLDRDRIKEIVRSLDIEDQILDETGANYQNTLFNQGNYLTTEEFKKEIETIESENSSLKRIDLVNLLFDKVFFNHQKAKLFLIRGEAYSDLAIKAYLKVLKEREEIEEKLDALEGGATLIYYTSPIFEFQDGTLANNLYYRYIDGKWQWSAAGKDSRAIWHDVLTIETDKENINPIPERNVLFIKSLQGKDYIQGLSLLVQRTLANEEGRIGNSKLITSDGIVSMDSKGRFEVDFKNTLLRRITSIYYEYVNEKWRWSPDEKNWMSAGETMVEGGKWDGQTPVQENLNIINSLYGNVNFFEGASILFDPSSENIQSMYGEEGPEDISFEGNLERRDSTKLINLMKALSTSAFNSNFKCYCGTNCEEYANLIIKYTEAQGLPDELLLLAIMIQESECKSNAINSEDTGLMQINEIHCGTKALPRNKEDCKKVLLEDEEENIRVGAQVLRDSYRDSPKSFICGGLNVGVYTGWEAALRGYNGWGCTGNNNYVEDVKEKYFELVDLYNGRSVSTGSSSTSKNLIDAAYAGDLNKVKSLVEGGANINSQIESTGGSVSDGPVGTALMSASFKGHLDVVKYLVAKGADLNVRNVAGGTAWDYANDNNHNEVANYLKSVGAKSSSEIEEEIFVKKGLIPFLKNDWLYYTYNSGWKWSPDKINWMSVSQTKVIGGEYDKKSPTRTHLKIIESLEDKGYTEGKEILKNEGATMEDGSEIVLISDTPTSTTQTKEEEEETKTSTEKTKEECDYEKINPPCTSYEDVEEWKFSTTERKLFLIVNTCNECGYGAFNFCDKEECKAIALKTGKNCVYSFLSCKEEINQQTPTTPTQPEEEEEEITPVTEASVREKILETMDELVGKPYIKYNQLTTSQRTEIDKSRDVWTWNGIQIIRDYDNSGSFVPNCFDSVIHVYTTTEVDFSKFEYCLNDGIVDVDRDKCQKGTSLNKNELEEGDILSIRFAGTIHNVIFIEWIDKKSGRARVFDWIGKGDVSEFPIYWAGDLKKFREFETNLKFEGKSEDYTVYAIGKPVLA